MFFKNQRRNPFSAYRAFMSPYKWTSSVMACQTVVNLASRSNHFKCKQFDSLSFSTPSEFCVMIQWNLDLRKPDLRKNLDLRKILVTPKIFLKSRFHCIIKFEFKTTGFILSDLMDTSIV